MNIPEEYRDRYDRLAAAHPWMREMRDADDVPDDELIRELRHYADDVRYDYNPLDDVFEPDERLSELCGKVADMLEARDETNGTGGETNGIADGSPLVDPVEIMRTKGFGEACDALGIDRNGKGHCTEALRKLADMVERDYVSRQDFAAQHRTLCAVREQVDAMRDVIRDFRDERDEWKTKCETWEFAYKQADAERKRYSEQIDELFAERDELKAETIEYDKALDAMKVERDEWKARVEGSSKVRVGQSNLEWLLYESRFGGECKMAMYSELHHLPKTPWNSFAEFSNWLMAPHDDGHSKPQSKKEPNLTEQSESLSDELDTREKLEADMRKILHSAYMLAWMHGNEDRRGCSFEKLHKEFYNLLDRQAEITRKAEQAAWVQQANGEIYQAKAERDRALARVDELHAEIEKRDKGIERLKKRRDELQVRVDYLEDLYGEPINARISKLLRQRDEAMAERDELQGAYDELTGIAVDLCRACGFAMVDASGEAVA